MSIAIADVARGTRSGPIVEPSHLPEQAALPHALPSRVDSLDGLRALAIGLVFVYHIQTECGIPVLSAIPWAHELASAGTIGVDLFYVLSGFFIARAVMRPAAWEPWAFARRRARRILPAYYASMLIIITLINPYFIASVAGLWQILSHVTLTHGFFPEHQGAMNGVYWTLTVEWWFYVLMLLSAPLLRSRKGFLPLIVVFLVVCYAWRSAAFYIIDLHDIGRRFYVITQLPGSLDEFVIGILLARWYLARRKKPDMRPGIFAWISLVPAIAIFCWCIWMFSLHAGDFWSNVFMVLFWRTCVALSFGLLIASFLHAGPQLGATLHFVGISYVGRISYSLYLYHLLIMVAMKKLRPFCDLIASNDVAFVLVCAAASLALASASYYVIELRWQEGAGAPRADRRTIGSAEPALRSAVAQEMAAP